MPRIQQSFYPAEEYHQDYHAKNPIRYKYYRYRSGRDQYLEKLWKVEPMTRDTTSKYDKPSDEELRRTLTPLQYDVTQEDATARAVRLPRGARAVEYRYEEVAARTLRRRAGSSSSSGEWVRARP